MPQMLPFVPQLPLYRFGTTLDGNQYLIDVRWNGRANAWYMDLMTDDETPIRMGIKIVLGTALGGRTRDAAMPDGLLIASDLSGTGEEPGFADLGDRVQVYFYPRSELE